MGEGRRQTDKLAAWVSIRAYARAWGLTRNTVYKLLEHQKLETYTLDPPFQVVRIRNIKPDDHQPEKP